MLPQEDIESDNVGLSHAAHLPLEVLEEVFQFTSTYTDPIEIPPVLEAFPWVLGRVCSRWRLVSRSMASLWTSTSEICFGYERPKDVPVTWGIQQLTLAVENLPKVARISVSVKEHGNQDDIPSRSLFALLSGIGKLEWNAYRSQGDPPLLTALPSSSLEHLKVLFINLDLTYQDRNALETYARLFGEAPRLQKLTVMSQMPLFIDSIVTWKDLHSLELITTCPRTLGGGISPLWSEMSHKKMFLSLPSLKSLSVKAQPELFLILLRLTFPWNQLTSFTVYWRGETRDVPILLEPLRQCESLESLHIESYDPPIDRIFNNDPITLPALKDLLIWNAVPPLMIKSLTSSGTLQSLELESINLLDFYDIVNQCPNLRYLECSFVGWGSSESISLPTIVLPHLKELCLDFNEDTTWPPLSLSPLLITPNLSSLEISVGSGPLPLEQIADLIKRSNMTLSRLELHGYEHSAAPASAEPLLAILSSLDACRTTKFTGVGFPESILDSIASRLLLPTVRTLSFSAWSVDELTKTIENRLKNEQKTGVVGLQDIETAVYNNIYSAQEQELCKSRLAEISTRYDVTISHPF